MQRNVYFKSYIAIKITHTIPHIFCSHDLVCRVTCDTFVAGAKTNEGEDIIEKLIISITIIVNRAIVGIEKCR